MRVIKLGLLGILFCTNTFAQDIKIIGTIDKTLTTPQSKAIRGEKPQELKIKLMNFQLSPKARANLDRKAQAVLNKSTFAMANSTLPAKVELGMNGVPVLNQGNFGSCVTFASTAAIDAILGKGDYISQTCSLQLGLYLEKNGYNYSGWDGSLGRTVLSHLENFGVVTKAQEKSIGCGGLNQYPTGETIPTVDTAMSLEQYHALSENLMEQGIFWSPLLDLIQSTVERTDTNKTLNDIKATLNEKDRVTFGVFLIDVDLGTAGAVGKHKAQFDSWILTPEIARDLWQEPNFAGHEMVITGFDDNAIAYDEKGNAHQGLLTLRNSWGEAFGHKGDFYMSYDYFKVLVIEAQRIRKADFDTDE